MPAKKDPKLARAGVSKYNTPKRTPNHPKKSHFKSRHEKIIAKGRSSAAYWADKTKWS